MPVILVGFTTNLSGLFPQLQRMVTQHQYIMRQFARPPRRLDYCGVITLIVSSLIPWIHFMFYCSPRIGLAYSLLTISCGALAVSVALGDSFAVPNRRVQRVGEVPGFKSNQYNLILTANTSPSPYN